MENFVDRNKIKLQVGRVNFLLNVQGDYIWHHATFFVLLSLDDVALVRLILNIEKVLKMNTKEEILNVSIHRLENNDFLHK